MDKYICVKDISRCPCKSQVTTINQVRQACLEFCHAQPGFGNQDMYSSACGKFCQNVVNQTVKQYGYSPCEKKIQPSVFWYQN